MNTDLNNTVSNFLDNPTTNWTSHLPKNSNFGATPRVPERKEMVNHPSHYQTKSGMEVIDVIEAFDLGFNLGNVIKYCLRCGKKDADVQELEKAKWYLEREIALRKAN